MATKKKNPAATAEQNQAQQSQPQPPKTRTPRALTPAQQTLIDSAKSEMDAARNKMKSAKALAKVIDCVQKLDKWALNQLQGAVNTRLSEFTE